MRLPALAATRAAALLCLLCLAGTARAAVPAVQLDELTWTELRDRVAAGATTVLIPIGGTEQSGPHLALGKHNVRVRVLAARIAQQLGDALVAPVVSYVPEGSIDPPTQHMRYPGTISIPEPAFEALLAGAARSLRQAGLCQVVLLGDHGGYRASLDRVAAAVNREWVPRSACRVHALPEFYRAAAGDYAALLKARGFAAADIGTHAGLADTALTLALAPALVRLDIAAARTGNAHDGVAGDPRRATAELGQLGADHIVDATVAAIRAVTRHPPP